MKATIAAIKAATAEAYGVTLQDLDGRRRTAQVALARQVAMYLARKTDKTFTEIGNAFSRDHGTVIHACRHIEHIKTHDPSQATRMAQILNQIDPLPTVGSLHAAV